MAAAALYLEHYLDMQCFLNYLMRMSNICSQCARDHYHICDHWLPVFTPFLEALQGLATDCIENLPCELQRNFQLMRELDQRTEDKKAEIDRLAAQYISTVRNLSSEERVEILQKIQNAYAKCKEYSDDKVQLAMQTYEMVDKHIRRLDADLARFEADLKDKLEGSDFENPVTQNLKKGRIPKEKKSSRGRGRRTSEEEAPVKKKPKRRSELADTILSVHPSDVLDMPVDPNEPTYCLCHQVSYGEMIGCDNPDCPIEWFHFACVDLTTKPKGKWFCPRCAQEKKKK